MGGLLSQGIVANGLVFTSGAIAQDPTTGQVIDGDIEEHTDRVHVWAAAQDFTRDEVCWFDY
ncbi:hypothetical protein CDV31_009915 [Fusarium ambrosium]|uniref:Uncharacterized protein n=1 Tax=Fusarium ambrosium TaxID=131363 RepID=A0A428TRT3_9HYPO|nr:hypothetical protein CDV31_009915 [Fusarium ambrosium]